MVVNYKEPCKAEEVRLRLRKLQSEYLLDLEDPVNSLLVQPFINYNFPHGWQVSNSPIITAKRLAAGSNRWTFPVGGGVGKIVSSGSCRSIFSYRLLTT